MTEERERRSRWSGPDMHYQEAAPSLEKAMPDGIDAIIKTIIEDVKSGEDAHFIENRVRARVNLIRSLDRQAVATAGGEDWIREAAEEIDSLSTGVKRDYEKTRQLAAIIRKHHAGGKQS